MWKTITACHEGKFLKLTQAEDVDEEEEDEED